jgi:hypothetical protein
MPALQEEFWNKFNSTEFEMSDYSEPQNAAVIESRSVANRKRANVDKENDPRNAKRPQNAVRSKSKWINFQRDNWV